MTRRVTWLLAGALGAATLACTSRPEPAELVLLNGRIVTLDGRQPEVRALASRDGRIVALGSDADVRPLVGPDTEVLDLEGHLTIPGFIEGHGHFRSLGSALINVELKSARNWAEVVERAAAAARRAGPGQWIVGRGWHQEKWDPPAQPEVEGYPVHERLSRATPQNPVLFRHASGHAALVNARAMELAGIGPDTPDPQGGTILHDAQGRPTGVLRETAAGLVQRVYAEAQERLTVEEREARAHQEIELADRDCLSKGVTSFQDAGSDFESVDRLRRVAEEGGLGVRLWVMLREDPDALAARAADYRVIGAADHHLTVRAFKLSIDGALGSHGAWLLEPYEDLPSSTGLNTTSLVDVERTAEIAMELGFQLCVHAIGDRGNRETLDLFQRAFEANPAKNDLRWRVEHAQHLSLEDIPRFAELGVIASMQAVHCTSDASWVPERLGQRRSEEGAYVWRKLIDSGAVVSNGTDTPVEDVDPIANFYSAVTREYAAGAEFYPDQRMTRMEALRSYTIDAAYAAFEEDLKGSLAPGKLADVTVLSRDILEVPAEEIRGAEVLYTIVGGRVLYRKL